MDRARAILLVDGSVTEGFRGVAVEQDDGQVVVHFRWRSLPYPLQVRVALGDVKDYSAPGDVSAWDVMGSDGLDVALVNELALAGQAATWWVAYVNNRIGAPEVAQLVVVHDGPDIARLQYLQVRDDLPVGVHDSVVAEMVYLAVFDAACKAARSIVSVLGHPAQRHIRGLVEQDDGTFAWRYDGLFLEPPVQTRSTHRQA